ncbi:beta-1,6-N-acetylglucosaminyltransferase [Methylobacterium sp. E-005]|uniref:beta-1,6-N-acetylglucosaminyltransferase n=1 Tax=Methylobacterium sp. E-005 TaxID=2836549 RepID=UPI001FBA163B|nr:beta-1,6-N-acetylglucosaminyltransferase [Methylobacterium sp. E-005]MCJ2084426.1 beta-1,6-N-acetylglucosaminyltransferase [Methylobacterium sp. E-005]
MALSTGARSQTKLAYVVLAHSDPQLFGRLMKRIANPSVSCFVHVDAKSPAEPFIRAATGIPRIKFVEPRLRVMWAGFSQVESTLLSIREAINETGDECTHIVIISGADYPLANNEEIIEFFQSRKRQQFIRRFLVADCGDERQLWRVKGRHFRELADRFTHKRKPLYALEQLLKFWPRDIPTEFQVALGSNWVALTRECALFCLEEAERNASLKSFFRPAFGPDEMFLHTIVQNSRFVDEASPVESYVDITGPGGPFYYGNVHALVPKVPIVDVEDAKLIVKNRGCKLFTRKLSSELSGDVLDYLDQVAGVAI